MHEEKTSEPGASANGTKAASDTSAAEQSRSAPPGSPATEPLPEVNFSTFVLSLSSSALFHFGTLPAPVSKTTQRNLELAKHTIDILGLLQEKTRGNLTEEEQSLLDNLLCDLRMRYVEEVKKEQQPG